MRWMCRSGVSMTYGGGGLKSENPWSSSSVVSLLFRAFVSFESPPVVVLGWDRRSLCLLRADAVVDRRLVVLPPLLHLRIVQASSTSIAGCGCGGAEAVGALAIDGPGRRFGRFESWFPDVAWLALGDGA